MQVFLKLFKVYWMWYNQHLLTTQVEQGFNFFSHVCWLYTLREVTYWLLCLNFTSVNSVQFSHSVVSESLRPHEPQHARPPCPSPTVGVYSNSYPLSRWCHPAISSSVVPFSSRSIRVFSNESTLRIRWPKYWSFSFSISPSNEHPGLISFRMDWLDLLAVQGTLKSLLQHHSSKASIFWHSASITTPQIRLEDYVRDTGANTEIFF